MEQTFLEWLQSTPPAIAVAERWFPWVESAHVMFLALVAGTIFLVDTRLLGLASRTLPVTHLTRQLLPWTWAAFSGATITGLLMFSAKATLYIVNTPFLVKMLLLSVLGVNMLVFHFIIFRGVSGWNIGRPIPAARAAGLISLVLWTGVIGFGRWIGFV